MVVVLVEHARAITPAMAARAVFKVNSRAAVIPILYRMQSLAQLTVREVRAKGVIRTPLAAALVACVTLKPSLADLLIMW